MVIGAGHNGLVAANYLADTGLSVTVVEASERVGGMTSTTPAIAGAPDHLINSYSVDAFFWDAFPASRDLALERYGLRREPVDPGHVYLHPDGASIGFWADVRRTIEEIRHFSAADARAYEEFARILRGFSDLAFAFATTNPTRPDFRTMRRLARMGFASRCDISQIVALLFSSASEVIAERFEHPVVRDALHASAGSTVPNGQNGTAASFLWLSTTHRHICRRPVGGVQAIPDALARRLSSVSGSVLTGMPVSEILVDGVRAIGVKLSQGGEIRARHAVLAACDPRTTLEGLLPDGALEPEMKRRVAGIPVENLGYGQLKVDLALSGRLELRRHQAWRRDDVDLRKPSHMIGTEAGIARTFARAGAGLPPLPGDELSIWPVIPTALDPSQGPEGQDTAYLYIATAPYAPEGGWDEHRDSTASAIVSKAAEYYDGLEDLEIGRQVLTNEEIGERTNSTGGNITHVDMAMGRGGPLRPARGLGGYRTPIDGLWLSGAGTHPGGGITGARRLCECPRGPPRAQGPGTPRRARTRRLRCARPSSEAGGRSVSGVDHLIQARKSAPTNRPAPKFSRAALTPGSSFAPLGLLDRPPELALAHLRAALDVELLRPLIELGLAQRGVAAIGSLRLGGGLGSRLRRPRSGAGGLGGRAP